MKILKPFSMHMSLLNSLLGYLLKYNINFEEVVRKTLLKVGDRLNGHASFPMLNGYLPLQLIE